MRKIEFRGKSIKTKKWVYGDLVKNEGSDYALESFIVEAGFMDSKGEIHGDITKVIPKTIGQFTGLEDKDGVKIYEGDIVETEYGLRQIVYTLNTFEMRLLNRDRDKGNITWVINCKIIGNKRYNPELLKEGK